MADRVTKEEIMEMDLNNQWEHYEKEVAPIIHDSPTDILLSIIAQELRLQRVQKE